MTQPRLFRETNSERRRYSPSAVAVIKFIGDRGLPIVAIVAAAIALTVVLLDRSERDARFNRALQENDARWIQAQSESSARWQVALQDNTTRWEATHHELDTKWQDSQRKSDLQWSQSYKTVEREMRLAQQDYADMKVEFLSRGMNPHPHLPGESQ